MSPLAINFIIIFFSALVVNTMMGMLFNGTANTIATYIISVVFAAVGLITFGVISADTVNIIVNLINQ